MLVLALVQAMTLGLALYGAPSASAATAVASTVDPNDGFPLWYQDTGGTRLKPCLDPADAACGLAAGGGTFNGNPPVHFPDNFPDEFFYFSADSDPIAMPACTGVGTTKISIHVAMEGAFVNGDPAAGEQMTFGRVRVIAPGGLCPNTSYRFVHPYGVETITTDSTGAIPKNQATTDIGCVPAPPGVCDFSQALASPVAKSFLRWDATAPAAPPGTLGDGVTPHVVTGATHTEPGEPAPSNYFRITKADGTVVAQSNLFTVMGNLAGPLTASPSPLDFGGQLVGAAVLHKTVTLTNIGAAGLSVTGATIDGAAAADFGATTSCPSPLATDATCSVDVTFSPSALGRRNATLHVTHDGVRSPLDVSITGVGSAAEDTPIASVAPTAMTFANQRVRTISPAQTATLSNSGTAPLHVDSVTLDSNAGSASAQYRLQLDQCTGRFIDPGQSCTTGVDFAPFVAGFHGTNLVFNTDAAGGPSKVAITGTATGGIAAVSTTIDPADGFPDWYRDEAGIAISECIDPEDPNCVVLPGGTFTGTPPLHFPDNFPDEFFYQVVDSDTLTTPGCPASGIAPGRAFSRSALEGAFANSVADGDQMVFGRIRFFADGLCPGASYTFVHPYGVDSFTADDRGRIQRARATEDIGCAPTPGVLCDFSVALSSRPLGGFLRWDPAVAPAAPAGYLGDAVSLHRIVGAPFIPPGESAPANYLEVSETGGSLIGKTSLFTVMGKLAGPIVASPDPVDFGQVDLATAGQKTVTFTNMGIADVTVPATGALAVSGLDAADFAVTPGSDQCSGQTLAPNAACTVGATFTPSATGVRTGALTLTHSGLNSPTSVRLTGTGRAVNAPAISFSPRSLSYVPLHTGRTSAAQLVSVSNAGGTAPLDISAVTVTDQIDYVLRNDSCSGASVAVGATCTVDVLFSPATAGTKPATLTVVDNAPGSPHSIPVTGSGTDAIAAVSPTVGPDGYPSWYGDANGVRVTPCLDAADPKCLVLPSGTYDGSAPVSFPDSFPNEFFYQVADSQPIATPGCDGTPGGNAFTRLAVEGSFANGDVVAGDQTTFGRIRIVVTSGLCPNTPYVFRTPYGETAPITTNATGGLARNIGTEDIGCGGNPCDFAAALGSRVFTGFLRWDPAVAPAAPEGYLGDAVTFHKVVGGTFTPGADSTPVNYFSISPATGPGGESTPELRSDRFTVVGKQAAGLSGSASSVSFADQVVASTSAAQTVRITNVGGGTTSVTGVSIVPGGSDFAVAGQTCTQLPLAQDATCTVQVTFRPTTTGTRTATLHVTFGIGSAVDVALAGRGTLPSAPIATVTPATLALGSQQVGTTGAAQTVRVTNTGNAPLTVGVPARTGAAAGDFAVASNGCTAAVAPGATCTVGVVFRPTATGARSATLTLPTNDSAGSHAVGLTGTGVAGGIAASPVTVDFGGQKRGQAKNTTLTLRSNGTVPLVLTSVTLTGSSDFTILSNRCTGTVLVGRTCQISLRFLPTAVGLRTASVVIRANTVTGVTTVAVRGTGK